jgi:hypothetical protein
MWSLSLFAEGPKDLLERAEVVWAMLGLTGALLVGAVVIYATDKWRKRAEAGTTAADEAGTLTSYRAMYEAGEITEAEYTVLRDRVAARVKKPAAAPAPVGAPVPPAPGQVPAPPANPPDPPPPA